MQSSTVNYLFSEKYYLQKDESASSPIPSTTENMQKAIYIRENANLKELKEIKIWVQSLETTFTGLHIQRQRGSRSSSGATREAAVTR